MHNEARSFVAHHVRSRHFGDVIEIGSRNVNGSVRESVDADRYIGVDIMAGPGVDCVADGEILPFLAESFDAVICCEVFEHTPYWPRILSEMRRVIRPGAIMFITTAGPIRAPHSGLDGGPVRDGEHYQNLDAARLTDALYDLDLGGWVQQARGAQDLYVCSLKP